MFPFKYEGLFVLMDQLQKVQMSQRWFGNQNIYTLYQKKMNVMKQTFKSLNISKRYFGDFKGIMRLLGDAI